VQWALVLWTAVLLYVVTFILGLVLSFLWLAFLGATHASDGTGVEAFSLITALLVVIVTGYGAWRVARRVGHEVVLHGFLVGLVVAVLSFLLDVLFSHQVQPVGLLVYALMVTAGWLGGVLASRATSPASPPA
jgi:putative membrane protein (TIGR04086 family)